MGGLARVTVMNGLDSEDPYWRAFDNRWWGWPGALIVGAFTAWPFLVGFGQDPAPVWLLVAVGAFAITTGWVLVTVWLSRRLRDKPSWPWQLRRGLVLVGLFGGLGVLWVLGVQGGFFLGIR